MIAIDVTLIIFAKRKRETTLFAIVWNKMTINGVILKSNIAVTKLIVQKLSHTIAVITDQ